VSRPSIRQRETGSEEAATRLVITHYSTVDPQEQVAGVSEIPDSVTQDSFFLLCLGLRGCSLIWKRLSTLFCL
jgi:hypothetical protein